jgi:hypothetical protein
LFCVTTFLAIKKTLQLAKQAPKKTSFAYFPFANISTLLKYKPIKKHSFFIGKGAKQACSKTKRSFAFVG